MHLATLQRRASQGENAADATRCAIDISFFSTVRAPDLDYYSHVGPRNINAADNYVGSRRRTRGTMIEDKKKKKNAVNPSSLSFFFFNKVLLKIRESQ